MLPKAREPPEKQAGFPSLSPKTKKAFELLPARPYHLFPAD